MEALEIDLGFRRKISFSLLGLVAGDAAMLILYSLITQPWQQAPSAFIRPLSFSINCSSFGWVVVGIPAVFLINTQFIEKLKWYYVILIGALLGSAALLIILMILGHFPAGQPFAFYWMFAVLVSCIAFSVYCLVVRRALISLRAESEVVIEPPLDIFKSTRIDITKPEPPLDIYKTEWLNTLEPSDPRYPTSRESRQPDSN